MGAGADGMSRLDELEELIQRKLHGRSMEGARTCPRCGKLYTEPPAISRDDNETELCPMCGTTEALEDYFGVGRGGLGNG